MIWIVGIGFAVTAAILLFMATILASVSSRLDEATAQLYAIKELSRRG